MKEELLLGARSVTMIRFFRAGTIYHLAWKCPAFAVARPPEPTDTVQLRLGWPDCTADDRYNADVLLHLAAVRSKVWSFAPSSRGRDTGG